MRDTSLYCLDGVRLPSVTECLELAGLIDFGSVPKRTLANAAQRGSDVHAWLEALDRGLLDPDQEPDERIAGYVDGWRRFRAEHEWQTEQVETVLVHREHRYAGTVDVVGVLNGRPAVLDYKTSILAMPWEGLQLAGYEMCLPDRRARFGLHLAADGSYKLVPFSDRNDRHDFLAAVRISHYRLRHGLAVLED